ncbi:hypothetical protein L198_07612 [Cryptococcus wingfieldii CBS 7118]|uniref:Uncharacterized protein n=1 Tax=Cryptococcus wingfieldii CBS 7118 TaxID=1295528 RepID=A0A1E3I9N9_9TREE|nr:hypothetical protein L198_07612 [Cryptococcus wingfieldii CBS 7118]ODN85287.1 hypothetical protein L198_07612 [Cryptococcus wingfieldii CBS 7118]
MGLYDDLESRMLFENQRAIEELQKTTLDLSTRIDAVTAPKGKKNSPALYPERLMTTARFQDVLNLVIGRAGEPALIGDATAKFALEILQDILQENFKPGPLARYERPMLVRVIGRFEAARDFYAAEADETISVKNQAFRAAVFGSCAKELRTLLQG